MYTKFMWRIREQNGHDILETYHRRDPGERWVCSSLQLARGLSLSSRFENETAVSQSPFSGELDSLFPLSRSADSCCTVHHCRMSVTYYIFYFLPRQRNAAHVFWYAKRHGNGTVIFLFSIPPNVYTLVK